MPSAFFLASAVGASVSMLCLYLSIEVSLSLLSAHRRA